MTPADPILTYGTRATAERHRFSLFNWLSLAGLGMLLLGALLAAAHDLRNLLVRLAFFTGAALFVAGLIVEFIRSRESETANLPERIVSATPVVAGDGEETCSVIIAETCYKTAAAIVERQLACRGVIVIRREAMLPDNKGRHRLRGLALLVRPRDAAAAHAVAELVLQRRQRVRTIVTPLRGNGPSLLHWSDERLG